ncbi:hypothetical protein WJX72_009530 [[Myrmecia] bisecta]|uniref:DNA replication licensing factor MCM5 n=1 Tax=[Myrmecia] bisecta TaxID=41462 RepID=A0AAW1PPJ0_9CHLO
MAGFDEGAVYYTDQNVTSDRPQFSRGEAQNKFGVFLRSFNSAHGGIQNTEVYKYSDALLKDKKKLRVDLQDVKSWDADLGAQLETNPAEFLPLLEAAAIDQLARLHNLNQSGEEQDFSGLQVLLHSSANFGPGSIRELTSSHVSQLVMLPGIVTAASKPRHKATHITIMCKDCKNTKVITCKPGMGGAMIPRACDQGGGIPGVGGDGCGMDSYIMLPHRSKYVDQQTLKLQERPEDVPTGELPRNMLLVVDRNLVGKISPGTRVTAIGIFSIYQAKEGSKHKDKNAVAIRQPYLRVVGLDEDVQGSAHSSPTFSMEEEQEFKEYAAQPGVTDRIFAQIAPQIFGHPDIKKAVACLLFGGSRKVMPDGTTRRGDINVLLLGDPSTAKSQFLKFASKTAPIAVYTSGKGSSAAGLTASVIRDTQTGEFYLEGGAMVLADNGVVCIDEFDKMRPEDRVAIHEAMEQQTISIAKAGITTMLKSRTSVLAAANPPSGRYDDLKSAQENIDLQSTILSRFDLIFIVKDERTVDRDKMIARHVLDVHRLAGAQAEADEEDKKAEAFLKRYLEYCRHKCAPRLSETASRVLVNEYVELREEVRKAASGTDSEMPAVPITVRQLEAIVRLSESLARMQLQTVATEAHVRQSIDLFKVATMDAVKSGLVEPTFNDEQRAELQVVEIQIKRRIAIGSYVSERKLIDELIRVGLSENTVRKALFFMSAQKDIDYRKERRLIHRLK